MSVKPFQEAFLRRATCAPDPAMMERSVFAQAITLSKLYLDYGQLVPTVSHVTDHICCTQDQYFK